MSYDDWKTGGPTGGMSESDQEAEARERYEQDRAEHLDDDRDYDDEPDEVDDDRLND